MEPKACQSENGTPGWAKRSQLGAGMSQNEASGTPKGAKGSDKGAKSEAKGY